MKAHAITKTRPGCVFARNKKIICSFLSIDTSVFYSFGTFVVSGHLRREKSFFILFCEVADSASASDTVAEDASEMDRRDIKLEDKKKISSSLLHSDRMRVCKRKFSPSTYSTQIQ